MMDDMMVKMVDEKMKMVDDIWMDENEGANLASCLGSTHATLSYCTILGLHTRS